MDIETEREFPRWLDRLVLIVIGALIGLFLFAPTGSPQNILPSSKSDSTLPPSILKIKDMGCKIEFVSGEGSKMPGFYIHYYASYHDSTWPKWEDMEILPLPPRFSMKEKSKLRRQALLKCADWQERLETYQEAERKDEEKRLAKRQ